MGIALAVVAGLVVLETWGKARFSEEQVRIDAEWRCDSLNILEADIALLVLECTDVYALQAALLGSDFLGKPALRSICSDAEREDMSHVLGAPEGVPGNSGRPSTDNMSHLAE